MSIPRSFLPEPSAKEDAMRTSEEPSTQPKTGKHAESPSPSDAQPWEELFKLDEKGIPLAQRELALAKFREYLTVQRSNFLGYQADQDLDYKADLSWMLDFHVNNIGDPFTAGNFTLNSKTVERRVLDYFAELWHASLPQDPSNPESYWGYVLTMGSTEGNMYGLWNARDYLSGKALIVEPKSDTRNASPRWTWVQAKTPDGNPNAYTPVAFFSEDTHYSFTKAVRVMGIQTFYELGRAKFPDECPLSDKQGRRLPWPTEVPSVAGPSGSSIDGPGEVDIDALTKLVQFFAERGYPILVSFNFGTTFKGAYDRVQEAIDRLIPIMRGNGLFEREVEYAPGKFDTRHGFWFHVDGALGAAYMPFLEKASHDPAIGFSAKVPVFDFRLPHVFSISMSGHKWIGAPWPCGLYMTKVKYQLCPPDMPVYIGSPDTTFAGSRNGFSPLVLWDFLARHSYADQIKLACDAQNLAEYAYNRLVALGEALKKDLYVARTDLAITVRFRKPNDGLVEKYSLSTEQFDGYDRKYAHIFLMHGIGPGKIDELIEDLSDPHAFDEQPPSEGIETLSRGSQPAGSGSTTDDGIVRLAAAPIRGRGFR
jgi:histidine decarboxylase